MAENDLNNFVKYSLIGALISVVITGLSTKYIFNDEEELKQLNLELEKYQRMLSEKNINKNTNIVISKDIKENFDKIGKLQDEKSTLIQKHSKEILNLKSNISALENDLLKSKELKNKKILELENIEISLNKSLDKNKELSNKIKLLSDNKSNISEFVKKLESKENKIKIINKKLIDYKISNNDLIDKNKLLTSEKRKLNIKLTGTKKDLLEVNKKLNLFAKDLKSFQDNTKNEAFLNFYSQGLELQIKAEHLNSLDNYSAIEFFMKAISKYKEALSINKNYYQINENLAKIYKVIGEDKEAKKYKKITEKLKNKYKEA